MSLSSLLSNDKNFSSLVSTITPSKSDFSTVSGQSAFSSKSVLKVSYGLANPSEASLLGTAFDYIARFIVAQVVIDKRDSVTQNLRAEMGLRAMTQRGVNVEKVRERYQEVVKSAKNFIERKDSISDEIIINCIFLAKVEQYYRNGRAQSDNYYLEMPEYRLISEIKEMCIEFSCVFIKSELIKSESIVDYNPDFGVASNLVSGADADIIVDGCLYDFKTTKNNSFLKKDAQQILCYYLLREIEIIINEDLFIKVPSLQKIERIALYKARYGEIEYFDVAKIEIAQKKEIEREIILHLKKVNPPLDMRLMEFLESYD